MHRLPDSVFEHIISLSADNQTLAIIPCVCKAARKATVLYRKRSFVELMQHVVPDHTMLNISSLETGRLRESIPANVSPLTQHFVVV